MKVPQDIVKRIFAEHPAPIDSLEIAAALESLGLTDKIVAQLFGEKDVFALARKLFGEWSGKSNRSRRERLKAPKLSEYLATFGHGLIFMTPLAATLFSATTFHFGLWTWTAAYNSEQGMSILLAP